MATRKPLALLCPLVVSATLWGGPDFKPSDGVWFDWPYQEPAAGSALDLSALNHRPAGTKGFIRREGPHFVTGEGQRIRFWGTNVSAAECFPDAASAVRLARRLAKGGINIVRIHHVDNPWAHESGGSLWKPGDPRRLDIDPVQLDILHRFIAALKAEGIYVNINLKVSRTHTAADGFPASVSQAPGFQKRLDYFEPRMIELQKRYAQQLLATKNPYTGLSLAEDPCMAVVEINNENALTGMRTREAGAYLERQIPEPFRSQLTALWNGWLSRNYAGRDVLAATWNEGRTSEGQDSLPADGRWQLDAQPGNEGRLESSARDAFKLTKVSGDGIRWRLGAYLSGLRIQNDTTQTLTFRARATENRPMFVAIGRDEPLWRTDKWRTHGLQQLVQLTPEWQEFRFVVPVHSLIEAGARLAFMAGHGKGDIEVAQVSLTSGSPTAGLLPEQDFSKGNVPVPSDPTPRQWRDWLTFLVDVEKDYVKTMRDYLQNDLHVRVPIVNTQANYGGIAGLPREETSDFTDTHCYWEHPDFGGPAGVWDTKHYTVINTPQLDQFGSRWFGELGGIAQLRVAGRPFTVTEVDTPAPSDYACELYPVLASFAGFQDWDGLFTFDLIGLGAEQPGQALQSFFDQHNHPAKWSFAPYASLVFREGRQSPASTRRLLSVEGPVWKDAHHLDVVWLRTQPGKDLGWLTDRLEVAPAFLPPGQPSRVETTGTPTPPSVRIIDGAAGRVYTAVSPNAVSLVGHVGGAKTEAGGLGLQADSFGRNFAALTAVSLDGARLSASKRVLLSLAARGENTDQKWNEARTSTMADWGRAPTRAEHVPATLSLAVDGKRTAYALLPDGTRGPRVETRLESGILYVDTRQGPRTVHYEIVAE